MRSLRARLVLVSLLVAVTAVAVTAWAVNRTTSNEVRGAVARDVEAEEAIYEELSFHAFSAGSWDDVDGLVRSLAVRFDERVALTTVEGVLIADSALLMGDDLPLPGIPARFIDPASPVIQFDEPPEALLDGLAPLVDRGRELADALEDAGISFTLGEDFGLSYPVWDPADPAVGPVLGRFILEELMAGPAAGGMPHRNEGLDPGAADRLADLLDGLGVAVPPETGLPEPQRGQWDLGDVEALLTGSSLRELLDLLDVPGWLAGESAEPALLFLGVGGEAAGALPDPVGWRLLLIVAGVALLAVAVTLLATRRVLDPVSDITRAARRMGGGDLGERVSVGGPDEIATLAGAFNAMADSLETQDRLRKSMTGDIAHELRTPLSNIRGYLEAIQEGVVEPSPELIASIHEEALHLQRLVDELQDLALAEAGELQIDRRDVALDELLDRVVRAHRPRAEAAGVTLEALLTSGTRASVDPGRIRQVIGNLLDNALRHTGTGGRIVLELEDREGAVMIAVTDDGTGIAAEDLPHVFERLYRADRSRSRETGGSGLGLPIARELVRLHGGDITVESRAGEGARFVVELPPVGRDDGDAGAGV